MDKKTFCFKIVAVFASFIALNLKAAVDYPYEYDFVSSDSGVSGKLFLDSSSSSGGTIADIGPGSYLSFNLYGSYLPPVTFSLSSLSASLDPNLSFAWNSSQITTPLDIAIGLGQNDVLMNREFANPNNTSPFAPEMDAVVYYDAFVDANQNPLNGQSISSSAISLIATEETINVGGGGVVYNIDFDPGTTGEWIGLVVVPEPGQMALLAAMGAAAFALFGKGKGHESIGLIFLRTLLRRLPPHRG
jgi:hypothetical protein